MVERGERERERDDDAGNGTMLDEENNAREVRMRNSRDKRDEARW